MMLRRILLLSLLLLTTPFFLAAQASLTGFWIYRVPTGDGNYRESFMDLTQSGETLTGKILTGQRENPITEGAVKDGRIHFVVVARFQNQERRMVYDGIIEGGKISLSSQPPGRDLVTGTLERSKPEAALPPPRLPLPELHDVPFNGLARTPPMGWNSWNKFAGRVDDAAVRGMADALVASGMAKAGYIYVNIDDTWQGPRDAEGEITVNRKFPDMKKLAGYVHSKGLKIGIYSSPGPKTCAQYEGSYGHEKQDADTYAAWGIDYLKYDWCSASRIYKDEDMRAVYQKMGDALRATGRPIVYSLCQYGRAEVWKWGPKVGGNLWRTTGDIRDQWKSMETIGFQQLAIASYNEPGHWNDPDMLEIGNGGMNGDEYRTHMTLWALLSAPLLAGNDLRTMSDDTKEILMNSDVIAIDHDSAAKPVTRISEENKTEVWVRELRDHGAAVALFNRDDQPKEVGVSWDALNLDKKRLNVRDVWKHQNVPATGERYNATVPAHGVVLLRIDAK